MQTLEILKQIDILALEAHRLWNTCEALKERIAREAKITDNKMVEFGIYVRSEVDAEMKRC